MPCKYRPLPGIRFASVYLSMDNQWLRGWVEIRDRLNDLGKRIICCFCLVSCYSHYRGCRFPLPYNITNSWIIPQPVTTHWISHNHSLHRLNYPKPVTTQTELPTDSSLHRLNSPTASHYTDWITHSQSIHRLNYPQPVTKKTELPTASQYTDWITHRQFTAQTELSHSQSLHGLNYPQKFTTD